MNRRGNALVGGFVFRFGAFILLLIFLDMLDVVQAGVVAPWTDLVARVSSGLAGIFDPTVEVSFPHQLLPDLIPSQPFVLAWHSIVLAFNAVFPVMIWMILQLDFFLRLIGGGGFEGARPAKMKRTQ